MTNFMHDAIEKHCKKYKYSKAYKEFWLNNPFCAICCNYSAAPHHIRSRGAGGRDNPENLLALCTMHHNEIHVMGVQSFTKKYMELYDKIFIALDIEKLCLTRTSKPKGENNG